MNSIKIGNKELILEELTFGKIKRLMAFEDKIKQLAEEKNPHKIMVEYIDIIFTCLTPHNDITKEWLEDNLKMSEVNKIVFAILGSSGMQAKQPGEQMPAR